MKFANAKVKDFFRRHIRKYGKEDIRAMGWYDEQEYGVRFELMNHMGDLEGKSILDVGCGFGGLYRYLNSELGHFEYLGVDILPEMIDIANKKSPSGDFKVLDILKEDIKEFDYVFAVGTFNIKAENYEEYFWNILRRMIGLAKIGVGICFLSDDYHLVKGPYHFENAGLLKERLEREFDVFVEVKEDDRLKGESCLFVYKN